MSNSESTICSKCGKKQEEESIICSSCGADLRMKTEVRSIDNRTLTHRPVEEEKFNWKSTTSKKIGRFTPGSQESGEFSSSSFAKASYIPSRDNAQRALILGFIGLIINFLYIFTIIGLQFVKNAELDNEDPKMIGIAKILLWLQVFGWSIIYIGLIIWGLIASGK